ncbi:MAG: response regulator [Alphaproteobacteria bacterium]|nr:response regulator [Alphaproteobacteria bacterium]
MPTYKRAQPIEILLVEDNEGDVFLTKKTFKDAKVMNTIHVARDGEEAMAILNKAAPFEDHITPDLILLDINLPKMDGRDVLDAIKNDDALKRIPVIVLSSSSDEKDIQDMYGLYANSYIAKPVDITQFSEVARTMDDFWMGIVKLPSDVSS